MTGGTSNFSVKRHPGRLFKTGTLILLTCLLCIVFSPYMADVCYSQPAIPDDKIKEVSTAEMDSILKGIATKNYDLYAKDFSDKMKAAQDRENFLKLCEKIDGSLGELKSLQYLGYFVQEDDIISLFKAGFSKTDDHVLIRLVLDFKNQKEQVAGLWFDSPKLKK